MNNAGKKFTRRGAYAIVFALFLLGVSSVPVIADSLGEPPATTLPPTSLSDSNEAPSEKDVADGIAKLEEEEVEEQAELEAPAAVDEREESQDAFADITPTEAQQLLQTQFAEQIAVLNGDPARFLSDVTLNQSLDGGMAALVTSEGTPELLDAGMPVITRDPEGELSKVDLTLIDTGTGYEPANPLAAVSLPKSASDVVELGEEGLSIKLVGASEDSTALRFGDKNLFYPDAQSDTDLLASPLSRGVELATQLRSVDSPETLSFEFDLPDDATLRSDENGGAEVVSGDQAWAHIPFPWAVDAQGTQVPVDLAVSANTLVLDVPHRELDIAYPIYVDPVIPLVEDWYNCNWYNGCNLQALSDGSWQWGTNTNWVYGSTSCIWSCWGSGRGLYVSTPSGTYGANQFGQWTYTPPGSTSYVTEALLNPFWRNNYANCPKSSYPQPHDYDGLWSSSNGWIPLQTNRANDYGNAQPAGYGRVVVVGLGSAEQSFTNNCRRDIMAAGVAVWIADPEPPAWNSKPTVADQWIDSSPISVSGSANDPGLGVKSFNLWTTDGSGRAISVIGNAAHSCSGLHSNPCPSSWSSQINNYNPSSLPNGINGMAVIAYDALGIEHKSSGEPIFLKVDHSAPTISYSGDLLSEKPVKYHLNVTGVDGNSGALSTAQSGMKQLSFYFDGQLVGRYPESATPPACKNIQQGIDVGSCKFENVELDLARSISGKHTLKILATDSLNHTSEKLLNLDLPKDTIAPTVNASGPLYAAADGWVSPSGSSVSVEALDSETGVTEAALYVDGNLLGQPAKQECFYGGCTLKQNFSVSLAGYSEGLHTFKLIAKDSAGNVGERNWVVKVDSTGPVLNPVAAPDLPSGWTPQVDSFTLNYSATDSASGVKKIEVIRPGVGGGTVKSTPYSSACTGSAAAPCSTSVNGSTTISTTTMAQGVDTVTVKAFNGVDQASNIETVTVRVDRSAPDVTAAGPLVTASSTTLVGLNTELNLEIKDSGSGVGSIELLLNDLPQQVITNEEIEEGVEETEGPSEVCTGETCELNYTFSPVIGDAESPGAHMFSLVVRDKAGRSNTLENEVLLDTKTPTVDLSGSLMDSVGESLSSQIAALVVEASDGEEEFASGIADIDVEVDGIPLEPEVDMWVIDRANNRVEGFDAKGKYLTKFGSTGSGNGQFNRPTSMAIDASGNLWVTDANNNRIQKFNSKGKFIAKFGSGGSGNGQFSGPEGIAADAKGNIWVADTYNRRIQRFNEAGEFLAKFGTQGTAPGQFGEANSIDIGPGGKVWVADWANNRVSQFNEAGEFVQQFGSVGAGDGQFNHPDAINVDSHGNVWVGDQSNHRIQLFNEAGEYLTQFGSKGSGEGQFSFTWPMGMTSDSSDRLWIADVANNRIQSWHAPVYDASSPPSYSSVFGALGSGDGQLKGPGDVTVDADGNIWVADRANHRIQKFDSQGGFLTKFGSSGSGNGQFNFPASLAIDPGGNIWVADKGNGRVQKFSSAGQYLSQFGSKGTGNGQFATGGPEGIAIDPKGNLWVSDTYAGRIQKFNPSGEFIKAVSSKGSGLGQLGEPTGIDIGPGGNVWVADWQNNRVAVFSEAGEFVRQFGTTGTGNGQFNRPDGIDIDSRGNVWVGDQNNGRVQVFNQKGEYKAQFGSKGSGAAQFNFSYPMGIATDNKGGLWITDVNNHRVQRWTVPNYRPSYTSTFGSLGSGDGQLDKPGDIAIAREGCSPGACLQEMLRSYSYDQGTWGSGPHTVVVTVTDAAGNANAEEVRVNEPLNVVAPGCPNAEVKLLSGGQVHSPASVIAEIEESIPSAVAPSDPYEAEVPPGPELEPSVTRTPAGVSLNELGIDVDGSMMGGGIEDEPAGSFTVGQATCLQPLQSSAAANAPTVVEDSAVVYPNSAPDADTVVRPTAFGAAVVEYLRGNKFPTGFSWAVSLDSSQDLVELEGGGVAIVSEEGSDIDPEEVPAAPEGGLQALNDTNIQAARAEHDLAMADSEIDGEVIAVIAEPEVVTNTGEVVPGILHISGGNIVTAELPPNVVAEAEAMIIQANPATEPESICATVVASAPEYAPVVCGAEEEEEEAEDQGDQLMLQNLGESPNSGLNSSILSAISHYENITSYNGAQSSAGGSTGVTDQQERFCHRKNREAECRTFFLDGLEAAEVENALFNVPQGSHGTRANAFRHSFWVALMRQSEIYDMDGIAWSIAHEENQWKSHRPRVRKESRMDILNNFVGHNRVGNSDLNSCEIMRDKSIHSIFLGAKRDPFVWARNNGYEYFQTVYRKLRDLGREGETGLTILSTGLKCKDVF